MTQLAIKGHKTRGNEVIEILEMFGGINTQNLYGDENYAYYTIDSDKEIKTGIYVFDDKNVIIFTLEEFLEKFPYKVGDKVYNIIHNEKQTITNLIWDSQENEVVYKTNNNEYVYVNYLQPYKEKTMEERKYADLRLDVDQDDKLATEATIDGDKITPPENYLIGKITKVDNGMIVEFIKKQPQYPKTYEECCKVLGINPNNFLNIRNIRNIYQGDGDEESIDYERDLLGKFRHLWELTIYRDAYWKIAGEQMGLDVPWRPDWLDTNTQKYCIYYVGVEIKKQPLLEVHRFLAFPTAEMRDEFYENFKELIEQCKELL